MTTLLPLVAQADQAPGGGGASSLVFIVLIFGVFYFLLIRPQQRRQRQRRALVASVEIGDRVVTIGGIHGTVQSVDGETLLVEVSPGTSLVISKGAIGDKIVDADTGTSE